ncbi:MAG: S41 family peptidase [Gammaproteobacteria bacterium]
MHLRSITLIGIVLSIVSGIALGIMGYHAWLDLQGDSPEAQTFDEVLNQVHDSYVDEVDRKALMKSALKGMLDDLDDHSNYLDAAEYHDLQDETNGRFGGVGIELGLVDDYFTVIAPLDGTPASRAGLQPGDRIIELDGESLTGRKLIEVVDMLRGPPGTEITLTIVRKREKPFTVPLERAQISVASVRGRLIEPGYAYIRISQFQSTTGEEFSAQLKALERDNGAELAGLVLDLRNNPGGVLQASVTVADTFLTEGLIVYTEGRLPSSHLKYRASGRDAMHGKPIVVLINAGSASAAEIVAGALKDHNRAQLLGVRSYGKGSVQSVMPLSGDRAIKLTTAYYYTPSGRSIHKKGIDPDVVFDVDPRAGDEALMAQALTMLKDEAPAQGLHARL